LDRKTYYAGIKERDRISVKRIKKKQQKEEYLRYLKDNQAHIKKRLSEVLEIVLRKRKETVTKTRSWIALVFMVKYAMLTMDRVNEIKRQYYKELLR